MKAIAQTADGDFEFQYKLESEIKPYVLKRKESGEWKPKPGNKKIRVLYDFKDDEQ